MSKSTLLAVIIAIIALVWIGSGFILPTDAVTQSPEEEKAAENSKQEKTITVKAARLTAEDKKFAITAKGRSRASREAMVSAEIDGQVTKINHENGDTVAKNEVLAVIEARDRYSRINEAKELVNQKTIEYQASEELQTQGFNSKIRLAEKKAELESAKAALAMAQSNAAKLNIKAPFDGILNTQAIELGDYVSPGTLAFTLLDLTPLEIVAFVAETEVLQMKVGTPVTIKFLDGRETDGSVSFIAPQADPEKRTFEIHIAVPNDTLEFIGGLTASIEIPPEKTQPAYKISPTSLTLNDEGVIGVKVLDNQNRVSFEPVQILQDESDGTWIGGLPENITVITVGQEFVLEGQTVKADFSDSAILKPSDTSLDDIDTAPEQTPDVVN